MTADPLPRTLLATAVLLFGAITGWTGQIDIAGPVGSGQFGTQVAVLPNGNFVVTDPGYDAPGPIADVGRVSLYDGKTLALINSMTGAAANDAVGSDNSGRGITVLANGDYVVRSSAWNGGRGAVTRCSATSGCPATISSANSLVGASAGNNVGSDGVTALPNGNYVVRSSSWDNGAADIGAITWCDGASGCTGTVTSANSRVGSTAGDQVGLINIIVLANGNYVSQDLFWDNGAATDAGAVTFCTGTAPCTGAISVANSLIGTTASEFTGNQGIFPLTNGNYVVCNDLWDNGGATDAGAATFCSGTTGCHATVGAANSLIGTTANDHVGLNGIAVLSNGNYVVRSSIWDNDTAVDAGAATFCNGTSGCTGVTVSLSNSLCGATTNDGVGRATALTNGHYVVNSPDWHDPASFNDNVGASTWCDGTTGRTGLVTKANSLTGDKNGDRIGSFAVALTNGNYVVVSQNWTNPSGFIIGAGAVTLCNGASGCVGVVSDGNSLVGTSFSDFLGNVSALANGNYVVTSGFWNNPSGPINDAGAATFCSGTSGCIGTISPANSLVGSKSGDQVGSQSPAIAFPNGDYAVRSSSWDSGGSQAGAVTLCRGATGCTGTVTAANSLVGSNAGDGVGTFFPGGVFPITNGDYIVFSPSWDNGGINAAGAVTIGLHNGSTVGPITASNSVRGFAADGGSLMNFAFDSTNAQIAVGRPSENIVTVFGSGVAGSPVSLKITSIARLANGHIMLQGIGVPSAVHTIERSLTTPAGASFTSLSPTTADGSGLISFEDTTSTTLTLALYRLTFP